MKTREPQNLATQAHGVASIPTSALVFDMELGAFVFEESSISDSVFGLHLPLSELPVSRTHVCYWPEANVLGASGISRLCTRPSPPTVPPSLHRTGLCSSLPECASILQF